MLLVWLVCIDGGSIGLGAACPPVVPVPPVARLRDPVDGYPPLPVRPVRHPRATPGSHAAGHRTPLHRRYRPGHMHEGCRGYRIRRARSTASISGMDAGRRISAARPRHPGAADIASAPHAGRYRWRLAGPPISAGVPLDTDIGHRTGRPGKRYRCGPAAAVGARTDHGMQVPPLIPACASGPRRDADTGLRRGRRYRRMSISECVAVSG